MLRRKLLGLVLVAGLSSSAYSEPPSVREVAEYALAVAPQAAADALTIDLAVILGLYAASTIGIISGIPFFLVPVFVTGAFLGQEVRHTCKHYVSNGNPSVLCGAFAGATKYTSKSLMLGKSFVSVEVDAIRGAVDVGKYEYDRASLIDALKSGDVVKVATMITSNEIFNEFFGISLNVLLGLKLDANGASVRVDRNSVLTAFLVPALLTTSIYTTGQYGDYVRDVVADLFKSTYGFFRGLTSGEQKNSKTEL